ncbi:MAG: phage capsid protein [Candidatus Diapherotrites archaeon]
MSVQNFVKEVWSARLIQNLYDNMTLYNLGTTRFDGEARYASKVYIHKAIGSVVADYTGSITYAPAQSTRVELPIDKQKYFAFTIPDLVLERTAQDLSLIDLYVGESAMLLAEEAQKEIAKLHASTDIPSGQKIPATVANLASKLKAAATVMNKNNVPSVGRWMIVSPEVNELLLDASIVGTSSYRDAVLQAGSVPTLYGFQVVVSNAIEVTTGDVHNCLFGTSAGFAFASGVEKVRALELPNSFDIGVSGYLAFGTKVLDSKSIGVLQVDVTP